MPSRKIEDLSPLFQESVRRLLDKGQTSIQSTGYTFFITDGFRSMQEQTDLYAQGRTKPGKIVTNAKAGESAHNYGLAVDCAFQKDGKLSYDASLYDKIYPIARGLGFKLGADWTSFPDKPHFEYPNWKQAINQPGGSMTDLQAYLGVTDDQAAKARLKEHLGELNGKCDWGSAEGIRGGFLGSERRNVGNLESQIAVLKTQIEQARAEGYAQGFKDATKPVDKVSLEEYLNLPPELYVTGTIISRR